MMERPMVKSKKLYEQVMASRGRSIAFRDFERLLKAFGFYLDRTVGSHRQYFDDAIEGWLEVARDRGYPITEPRYRPAIYAA